MRNFLIIRIKLN